MLGVKQHLQRARFADTLADSRWILLTDISVNFPDELKASATFAAPTEHESELAL